MLLQEFQAVVLAAGKGSRMPEITAGKPKCLLPVGNKPLVWYPLYKLQQLSFTDVILVVAEHQKVEIQNAIDKNNLNIKIDYFTIGDEELGTADSLRLMGDKLKSDVLILSCDLISDVNLKEVLDLFRKHNASLCTLLFNPTGNEPVIVPGPKAKHKPERDLIGVDVQTNRLVFLASASDFESNVSLPLSLIKKHTNITMYSNLIDSHVYVLKNWILKYLQHETGISTIKGELLPHIIKKQLLKPPKVSDKSTSMINPKDTNDIFHFAKESDLDLLIRDSSTFNDHYGDLKPSYHNDVVRCFACITGPDVYGIRANTLSAYCAITAKIIDKWEKICGGNRELVRIDPKAEVKSNQVDERCFVWESAKLSEKTSYKNSTIGTNSEVNNFSRVFNSVVMDNVVVKERVALENCIVCDGAVIETGSQLKNCLVGSNHTVPEQSAHSNDVLTVTDRLMEF